MPTTPNDLSGATTPSVSFVSPCVQAGLSPAIRHILHTKKPGVYFLSCADSVIETHLRAANQWFNQKYYQYAAQHCRYILEIKTFHLEALNKLTECILQGVSVIPADVPHLALWDESVTQEKLTIFFYRRILGIRSIDSALRRTLLQCLTEQNYENIWATDGISEKQEGRLVGQASTKPS